MPQRIQSPASDESHKENAGISPKSLRNKNGRLNRTARAEGSGDEKNIENATRRGDVLSNEEDYEGEEPEGVSHKRRRVSTGGDSRPIKNDPEGRARLQITTLIRDSDGYVTGSIMRIQLENFVTYDYVEFRPGPHLNMVLGPNGTGKSSIACAICLGLNFPPNLLGRQDLNSFVKQTKERGHIEIELKGPPGKPNIVIRRNLMQNSKSSTFTINGRQASGRDVNTRIAQLNIQVSNLCTFLPQDRVSEFARMSPQQLLRETERAAGDENLTAWHDALISSGKELKTLEELMTNEREQLKTMQERNASLETEVKRYEERQQLEQRLVLLDLILPSVEYLQARDEYRRTKIEQRLLYQVVAHLKKKHAPMIELKKELEQRERKAIAARKDKAQITKETHKLMKAKSTENEKIMLDQEEAYEFLTRLKAEERDRQKKIHNAENAVAKLQQEIDNPPDHENLQEVEAELNRARAKLNKVRGDLSRLQYQQGQNITEEAKIKHEVDQHRDALRKLDNESDRKLQNLARIDRDCADTVHWLRHNSHRFKLPIIEPPCMSMTVRDPKYVDAIDSLFSAIQMKTFVTQCEEDYKLLMRFIADTDEALGRKAHITAWYRKKTNIPDSPMNAEQMTTAGFEGYAIGYVECPDELRWYLKAEVKLHRTAISLDPRRVDANLAMRLVGRSGGASFVTGNILHMVLQSNYGKRLASSMTREIQIARWLGKADVDPSVKIEIQKRLGEAENQLSVAKETIQKVFADDNALRSDEKEMKDQFEDVQRRRTGVTDIQKKIATAAVRLQTAQARLEELRNAPSVEQERAALKKKIDEYTMARFKLTKDYLKLVQRWEHEIEDATRAGLRVIQFTSDKENLETVCSDRSKQIDDALIEYNKARKKYDLAKQLSKEKLELSRNRIDSVEDEVRKRFKALEDSGKLNEMTADGVEAEMQEVKAELEMNLATNGNVLEQFQRRKAEIETLTITLADREAKCTKIGNSIKTARDNWEPALNNLVDNIGTKFSNAFDRIGCAGEIRISHADDYDKWAIDILVKFRDTEKLQLLTAQRQSGGERSLTTILYLMSLTEQARSPFSLVDEINQGMDQRAERAVHNQLVDVTCNSDVGQYFLITPKLLPNLSYHERMKVLCVNNGEWLPEENALGNMMNMIEGFVRHRTRST